MTWRFQKRISTPFGRINLSKGGVSLTEGVRGAHLTVGKRGVRTTVGLPGSGLSFTTTMSRGQGGAVTFIARGLALMLGAAIGLAVLMLFVNFG